VIATKHDGYVDDEEDEIDEVAPASPHVSCSHIEHSSFLSIMCKLNTLQRCEV